MTTKFSGSVLALDLATVTGYAHGKPGKAPSFGHQRFGKTGASRPEIYRQFRLWLALFTSAHDIKLIVFESPAVPSYLGGRTNIGTTKLLFGLSEHLEEWAYGIVELREATVGQVRSHFIGQNMKAAIAKPLVKERCRELGWPVETDDEAAACSLWDYQICCLRPDIGVAHTPLFGSRK